MELNDSIRRESINATQQLEALQQIRLLLGDVPAFSEEWNILPQVALRLLQLMKSEGYDLIIEYGSGISTHLILLAAIKCLPPTSSHATKHSVHIVDHSIASLDQVRKLTTTLDTPIAAVIEHSSLQPWGDSSGEYMFFCNSPSISASIHKAIDSYEIAVEPLSNESRIFKILVVISNSPRESCQWSPYPVLPVLLDCCSSLPVALDFIALDTLDYENHDFILQWNELLDLIRISKTHEELTYPSQSCSITRIQSLLGLNLSAMHIESVRDREYSKSAIADSLNSLDDLLSKLEKERAAVEKQLKEQQCSLKDKSEQLTEIESERSLLNEQLIALHSDYSRLQSECSELNAEREKYTQSLSEIKQQLENNQNALTASEDLRITLAAHLAEREENLRDLSTRFEALSNAQKELAVQLDSKDQELHNSAAHAADLAAQLDDKQQKLLDLNTRFEALSNAQNELAVQLDSKDQELRNSAASNDELNRQLVQRGRELYIANKDLQEAQRVADLTLIQLHQTQHDLIHYHKQSRLLSEVTAQLESKESEIKSATASATALSSQLQQRNAELENAKEDLSKSQEEIDLILRQLHQVQNDLVNYHKQSRSLIELQDQLHSKEEILKEATTYASELTVKAERREKEISDLKTRVKQLSNAEGEAAAQLRLKEHNLKSAESRISELNNQLLRQDKDLVIVSKRADEAQEETELTLIQLHQVQEELEHYFLRSRSGDTLRQALAQESSRAMSLLVRMIRLQTNSQ
jgi:predicted nuclease with TOPRIM domain